MIPIAASIAALVVGAAMQAKAASDAASRQRRATEDALRRQSEYQRQAEERALKQAAEYKPEERKEKQDELADTITQDLYRPVAVAQATNDLKTATQGAVSSDYQKAKAASSASQQKMAQELAGLLGRTKSAARLRQHEAIGLSDAASDIARLGNYASGQYGVDKMAIDEAGRPNAGLSILGGVASTVGATGLGAAMK